MSAWIADPAIWLSLATLTVLEIVLGIDNLLFLSILADRLPSARQAAARRMGLLLALVMRVGLLLSVVWIMRLTEPLFSLLGHALSWRDLILIAGGLFLVYKATREIHGRLEGGESGRAQGGAQPSFAATVLQIGLLDVVFSLDSVITAVGMTDELAVMIAAVAVAMLMMLLAAGTVSGFVNRHPTVKMLALSFLMLIGVTLIADGTGLEVPKGYIYAAIGFSVLVELLNQLAARARRAGRRSDRHG